MSAWEYWVVGYYGDRGPKTVPGIKYKTYPMPDQAGKLAVHAVHNGASSRDMEIRAFQSREDIARIAWGTFNSIGQQIQHYDGPKAGALNA